eukprot:7934479-Lingulodinium_polyedra.AAC.1
MREERVAEEKRARDDKGRGKGKDKGKGSGAAAAGERRSVRATRCQALPKGASHHRAPAAAL